MTSERPLRPISSARARALRSRGESVWWDEKLRSHVWRMKKPAQNPPHVKGGAQCWCGHAHEVEVVYG